MSLDNLVDVRQNHKFEIKELQKWFDNNIDTYGKIKMIKQFVGGQSNPTYVLFFYNEKKIILRKQPPGELLPSAHDVAREYKIQKALESSTIPCPRMIKFCDNKNIIGTDFYLMELVEGKVYENILDIKSIESRKPIYLNLVKMLAKLHKVNFTLIGMEKFGKIGNYVERQINRWEKQWFLSKTRSLPIMTTIINWLKQNIPEKDETSLVHGDYRIGNVIYKQGSEKIVALLDWELSTLGNPYSDLGYLLHTHFIPFGQRHGLKNLDFKKENIPTVEEIVNVYCNEKEIDIVDPYFYVVLSMFRSTAILEGVYSRYVKGNESSPNAKEIGKDVEPLAKATYQIIKNM
ncbi:MAG: phosphotransferase family protein [Rickettsiales bacterium]|nr:phosphotransferase family protein [Rickettsiales bacterium]